MSTERRNPRSVDIDLFPTERILKIINAEDATVANAVSTAIPEIARVVDLAVEAIRAGGRVFYVGAGTSGRLALLDAAECPPTFSTPAEWVQSVLAGGSRAFDKAKEGDEDDHEQAQVDLQAKRVSANDLVIGVAASGKTPYTLAALDFARSLRAKTAAIVAVPGSPMTRSADVTICTPVGPEVITGSTRMKAGTAQKMVLNMISTTMMIRLGMTYSNWMINVSMTNQKLRERGMQILREVLGLHDDELKTLVDRSGGNLKVAVVMGALACDRKKAEKLLKDNAGNLRKIVAHLEADVSNAVLAIEAGTLYTPHQRFSPGRLIVDGGIIAEIGPADRVSIPSSAQRIDASAFVVSPGFIDPHIHGCGGVDVMEGTYDALNVVSRIVARHGTTSFLPTTVSSPIEVLTSALERLGNEMTKHFAGATPCGIHLEGPFINSLKRGTHRTSNIQAPDPQLLHEWIRVSQSSLRLLTLAPELAGSLSLATVASECGIRVAMGHSNASLEEASAAMNHGVCYAVHTFNAMREFSHREPGIAGAVLSDDRVFAEIIADGIHVHPSVVRFFARAKRAERILLVTDAMSATDMPDGQYSLGQDRVTVENGVCRDSEGRLAGSTLTQDVALKNFVAWTGFSLQEALLALTDNPARAIGLRSKGILEPGADADIAILDMNFHVMKTFVAGKLVFER